MRDVSDSMAVIAVAVTDKALTSKACARRDIRHDKRRKK
jgi:hypothetical protein